jgi:hypothetical protein
MSALHWFEIPVNDIHRACEFYAKVLDTHIQIVDMQAQMGSMLGMIPNRDGVGGALVQNPDNGYKPNSNGTLVYLVVDGDLTVTVDKIQPNGGSVVMPKTPLGDSTGGGYVAWIIDTEGYKVGLFSES